MTTDNAEYTPAATLLRREQSRLLVIDVQDRLVPAVWQGDGVVANCTRLVQGAQILGVPVSVTEQYPKGLGPTVPPLAMLVHQRQEKLRFSAVEVLGWGPAAEDSSGRFRIVVAGFETHVCVLQTVLDLLALGYEVHVPHDAVASRSQGNHERALDRLTASGAVISSAESVLFEWCGVAGTPEFRQISQLVK